MYERPSLQVLPSRCSFKAHGSVTALRDMAGILGASRPSGATRGWPFGISKAATGGAATSEAQISAFDIGASGFFPTGWYCPLALCVLARLLCHLVTSFWQGIPAFYRSLIWRWGHELREAKLLVGELSGAVDV